MRRGFAAVVLLVGCSDDATGVFVEISSDLRIPAETNNLVVRVSRDGDRSVETTYPLGPPPNDDWPQTVPIVRGENRGDISVAGELRINLLGMPSVAVGFGETTATLPSDGFDKVFLEISRSCKDDDQDGFGVGFGCEKPDCDDEDPRAPGEYFCGQMPQPDAGMKDGGPDSGLVDGGPDAGDAGIDGGPDAGTPDAGGEPCGMTFCVEGERCSPGGNECLEACSFGMPCTSFTYSCLETFGVCICRVPCNENNPNCGPFECVDGCCQIE